MAINPKKGPPPGFTGLIPKLRFNYLVGAAAGNLTLTGIRADRDFLVQVIALTGSDLVPWGNSTDLTSEFSITADNTINNTGGTSTALKGVLVIWYQDTLGEQSNSVRS